MRNFRWEQDSGSEEMLDMRFTRKGDGTIEARNLKTDQTETYQSADECTQAFSDLLEQD